MTCEDALDRMLEADPGNLSGGDAGDADLAAHLRECSRCAAVAAALSAELQALDRGLGELAAGSPRPEVPAGGAGTGGEARPREPGRRRASRAWVPLAAAAILAAVLVLGRSGPDAPGEGPAPAAEGDFGPEVAVTLPADRRGAVMSTSNPRITVVWLYERSEP